MLPFSNEIQSENGTSYEVTAIVKVSSRHQMGGCTIVRRLVGRLGLGVGVETSIVVF